MNKKTQMKAQKVAALIYLLLDELDGVCANGGIGEKISKLAKELQKEIEPVIDDLYRIEGVKKSTYLTDISNKVDTVIRKNFISIKK